MKPVQFFSGFILFTVILAGAYWRGGSDREAHLIAAQVEALAHQQAQAATEARKHETERLRLRNEAKHLQRRLAKLGRVDCRIGLERLRIANDALSGHTVQPVGAVPAATPDPD